ncbi:hypothetical protein CDAR_51531, partial [Caerostris darwini]
AGNAPVLHVYDKAKAVRYERLSKTGKICAPGFERALHGSGWLCIIKSGAPLWERINLSALWNGLPYIPSLMAKMLSPIWKIIPKWFGVQNIQQTIAQKKFLTEITLHETRSRILRSITLSDSSK